MRLTIDSTSSARPSRRSRTASGWRGRRGTAGRPTAARSWRWTRTPARSSRSPRTRRTSRASSGLSDGEGLKPLLEPEGGQGGQLPGPQPGDRRASIRPARRASPSPPSRRSQQRIIAPTTRCSARPATRRRTRSAGRRRCSRTGTRSSASWMEMPTALAQSCDTYFYQLGYDFYNLPPSDGQPLQAWARRFGFGSRTGIDLGPEASGLAPDARVAQETYTKDDPSTGDRPALEAGRLDPARNRPEGHRGHAAPARPLLRADRERRQARHAARRRRTSRRPARAARALRPSCAASRRRCRRRPASTRPTLQVVREGLYHATHDSYGTSSASSANFPIRDRRQDRHGREGRHAARLPSRSCSTSRWWCGYGPVDKPTIVVCARDRERRPRRHGGGARRRSRCFEQYFHVKAARDRHDDSD